MKKTTAILIILYGLVVSSLFTSCKTYRSMRNSVAKQDKSIVVLYENDVHCAIEGYALMAGLRDAISDTAIVAIVSNGDFLQGGTAGAISHGQYIIDIMKHVGYDALTLGNHEFDYSVPRMIELLAQLNAPVTCVNFRDMLGNVYYAPYVIKVMGSKKVAFIGAVTPTTLLTEAYSFYDKDDNQLYDLAEKEVYQLVQKSVDEVRKAGADFVIILSHLGEDKNTMDVDSYGLIENTNGIDFVLDGHTHKVFPQVIINNKDGEPVIISQTGTKFQNVGKLVITPDGHKSTELISRNKLTHINAEVKHVTDSIVTISNEITSRPICQSDVDIRILDSKGLQEVRKAETNAGDIVTDAYRIMTGADFAITNGGGIRTELKAGQLTYGDLVALLPYDNYVSVVEITGQELVDVLKACTQFLPALNGDFPQVSGMKFTVNVPDNSISELVVLNKVTNEYEPVDLNKTYRLATIDYCITGGGLQGKLKKNKIITPNIVVYNECLIQYVTDKLNGHITKEYEKPQGRIIIKN